MGLVTTVSFHNTYYHSLVNVPLNNSVTVTSGKRNVEKKNRDALRTCSSAVDTQRFIAYTYHFWSVVHGMGKLNNIMTGLEKNKFFNLRLF